MTDTTDPSPAAPDAAPPERLKILGLKARNVLRISSVQLHPDGKSVVLGGPNMAGKSSTLDAIAMALAGKKKGPKVALPLRTGTVKGEVQIDLGSYVVTRTWTRSSDSLVVTANGVAQPSPQALLDRLIGDVAFDPLSFMRKDDAEQARILRKLVGLDTSDLDDQIVLLTANRKTANAEVKRLKALVDSLEVPPAPPPVPASVSVSALLEERAKRERDAKAKRELLAAVAAAESACDAAEAALAQSRALKEQIDKERAALRAAGGLLATTQNAASRVADAIDGAAVLPSVVAMCRAVAAAIDEHAERLEDADGSVQELVDTVIPEREERARTATAERATRRADAHDAQWVINDAAARLDRIDLEIRGAEEANAKAASAKEAWANHDRLQAAYQTAADRLSTWEGDAERYDHEISMAQEQRLDRLSKAKFPVDGLSVDADTILFRGVPLAQASHAERLRVVVAIAAALNPALSVVIIREGAFLDDNGLRELLAAVDAAGLQAWVEVVGDREGVTVLIEDGAVKEER